MKNPFARWLANRPNSRSRVREVDSTFYDQAFSTVDEYHKRYWDSRYYFAWTVICDRLKRRGIKRLLEIGCGPGQLAEMLIANQFSYAGFDYSPVAIEMARSKGLANARFEVADATATNLYESVEYEAVVCTEVLEHVQNDEVIINAIRPGSYCICTVPSFPYVSHVRCFESSQAVEDRYSNFFESFDVLPLRKPNTIDAWYFLFDGLRNAASLQRKTID